MKAQDQHSQKFKLGQPLLNHQDGNNKKITQQEIKNVNNEKSESKQQVQSIRKVTQKKKQKSEIQVVNYKQNDFAYKSVMLPDVQFEKSQKKLNYQSQIIAKNSQNTERFSSQKKKRVPQFLKKSFNQQFQRSSIQTFDKNFNRYIQEMLQDDNNNNFQKQVEKQEIKKQNQHFNPDQKNFKKKKNKKKKNKKKYSEQEKSEIREKVRKIQENVPQLRQSFFGKISNIMTQKYFCYLCQQQKNQPLLSICKCDHQFCFQCLQSFVSYKVSTFNNQINCPQQNCQKKFDQNSQFFKYMPQSIRKKFERNKIWIESQKNNEFRLCPRQSCDNGLINLKQIPPKCQKCQKTFCLQCQLQAHQGPCQQNFAEFCLQLNWKRCPQCKVIIEKNQGCNHMTCTCKYQFCYVCLSKWTDFHYQCGGVGSFYQYADDIVHLYNLQRNQMYLYRDQERQRYNVNGCLQPTVYHNFSQPIFKQDQSCCLKFLIVVLFPIHMLFLSLLIFITFIGGMIIGWIGFTIIAVPILMIWDRMCVTCGDFRFIFNIPFIATSYVYYFYVKTFIRCCGMCIKYNYNIDDIFIRDSTRIYNQIDRIRQTGQIARVIDQLGRQQQRQSIDSDLIDINAFQRVRQLFRQNSEISAITQIEQKDKNKTDIRNQQNEDNDQRMIQASI